MNVWILLLGMLGCSCVYGEIPSREVTRNADGAPAILMTRTRG